MVSLSFCSGRSPVRRVKVLKSRTVSSNCSTPMLSAQAFMPRLAKRVHGSISSSDASVRETQNGISETIEQESTDTDGRLHATVLTFTGFSDAEVKRVIPAELVHFV